MGIFGVCRAGHERFELAHDAEVLHTDASAFFSSHRFIRLHIGVVGAREEDFWTDAGQTDGVFRHRLDAAQRHAQDIGGTAVGSGPHFCHGGQTAAHWHVGELIGILILGAMQTVEELRCLSAHFDAHLLRVVAILRAVAVFMVDGHHRHLQDCALLCGGRHIDVTRVVEQHERRHLVGTIKRELMEHVDDALLEGISLVVLRRGARHGGGFGIEMAESQERLAERNLVGEAAFVLF